MGKIVLAQKWCDLCLSLTLLLCPQVQLQLLTAIVKLFLKKPTETQELVQQVLSLATQVGNSSTRGKSFLWASPSPSRRWKWLANAIPIMGGR